MKIAEKKSTWVWIILEITTCSAILTGSGHIYDDITSIPKYGCQWTGGHNTMVNCTCREDAEEFYIRQGEVPTLDTWAIEINNCKRVIFGEHAIEDLRNLRHLHLRNIPSLTLLPESLNWFGYRATYQPDDEVEDENIPSLKIVIENCHIDKISQQTFKGRIKEIRINRCYVTDIEPFAFSSLRQSQTVSLQNTKIESLKIQAFKLFSTKELLIENVTLGTLPSRAFSNLKVTENLKISNSNFGSIYSGAFIIDGAKWFEVSNSNITTLDSDAFDVSVKGDVHFKNNYFDTIHSGAFLKITPSKDLVTNTALYLTLESTYVSFLGLNALEVNGLKLKFVDFKVNDSCNCDGLMSRFDQFRESFSEIKCSDGGTPVSLADFKADSCTILSGHTTMIVVIGIISILLLIMIILGLFYYHKTYREGKYGNSNEPTKNVGLIVPDGRTYKETEVHVILERADLLTTDL
ncbi:hypothetical protein WA026_014686 [Henosepilachna vigintioctopunctata]|uniref:Uncharacterized protein n=1 Tax=Henosepilachna vigintioctopunctata TaxID=420089 RepID=A0AAW1VFM2_9CUCU